MSKHLKISTHLRKAGLLTTIFLLPATVSAQIVYKLDSYLPFSSLEELIVAILRIFITIAVPIIVLFIIYAGFLMVTANGKAEQIEQGKRALLYAVIGGLLILGANLILAVIQGTVGAFTV